LRQRDRVLVAFTGVIINDVEFGQDRVIKGGKLNAFRPIDVISVFPPLE
jgi:hypothetical protein